MVVWVNGTMGFSIWCLGACSLHQEHLDQAAVLRAQLTAKSTALEMLRHVFSKRERICQVIINLELPPNQCFPLGNAGAVCLPLEGTEDTSNC